MDLKALNSFLHVAELGSLSRAAARLGVSQPALSRQLKLLEESLGQRLLLRTGRGVVPTDAGELLLLRARPLLDEVARIRDEFAARSSEVTGRVAIGLSASVGVSLTGPLVARFRNAYPEVALHVVEDLSGSLQDELLARRLDLALLYAGATSTQLSAEPLWAERLYLIGSAADALPAGRSISLEEVAAMPLILSGRRHGLRAIIELAAVRQGLSLRCNLEADALRVQLDLTARGLGRTILPWAAAGNELTSGQLSAQPIGEPPLLRGSVLAWPRAFPLTPAARALADTVRAMARERPSG